MSDAVVCDNCQGVATRPCEFYQADHWAEDGHRLTLELCPDCAPDELVDLLDEEDQ